MKKSKLSKLLVSIRIAKEHMAKLSPRQKSTLEKSWDIEHAYYSSVLEGSKLDRKEFEKLALEIA